MEMAYQSGKLHDRITPHCYGAFEGDGIDVLVLELCDGTINGCLDCSEAKPSAAELSHLSNDVQSTWLRIFCAFFAIDN
jgi:hypothetical protein